MTDNDDLLARQLEVATNILSDFAAYNPVSDVIYACRICGYSSPDGHAEDCVWRRAVTWLASVPSTSTTTEPETCPHSNGAGFYCGLPVGHDGDHDDYWVNWAGGETKTEQRAKWLARRSHEPCPTTRGDERCVLYAIHSPPCTFPSDVLPSTPTTTEPTDDRA